VRSFIRNQKTKYTILSNLSMLFLINFVIFLDISLNPNNIPYQLIIKILYNTKVSNGRYLLHRKNQGQISVQHSLSPSEKSHGPINKKRIRKVARIHSEPSLKKVLGKVQDQLVKTPRIDREGRTGLGLPSGCALCPERSIGRQKAGHEKSKQKTH